MPRSAAPKMRIYIVVVVVAAATRVMSATQRASGRNNSHNNNNNCCGPTAPVDWPLSDDDTLLGRGWPP